MMYYQKYYDFITFLLYYSKKVRKFGSIIFVGIQFILYFQRAIKFFLSLDYYKRENQSDSLSNLVISHSLQWTLSRYFGRLSIFLLSTIRGVYLSVFSPCKLFGLFVVNKNTKIILKNFNVAHKLERRARTIFSYYDTICLQKLQ